MKVFRSLVYLFTIVLLINSSFTYAQVPDWKWCKSATGTGKDEANAIAVDGGGNIYIAGNFRSASFNIGGVTLTNLIPTTTEIFIAKYTSTGYLIWAKRFGNKGNEIANDICIDGTGNIYLTGNFTSDTFDLGNGVTLYNSSVWIDPFVAKFTTGGDVVWAKSAEGATNDEAHGVAVDASGNVFITGFYDSDTLIFNKSPLAQIIRSGVNDVYLAKYNNSGIFQWVRGAGGEMEDEALGVAIDNLGNAIITGYFQSSTITFGDFPLTNANNFSDMFLTKYNTSGNVLWTKIVTGDFDETGNSITTDGNGNIFVCGNFNSPSIDIGTTTLNNALPNDMSDDVFVAKFNSSGVAQWANQAGGTSGDYGNGVAVDYEGNVYITGNFVSATFTIGATVLNNTDTKGSGEIFAAKYNSSGGLIKAISAQSNGDDDSRSIAAYSNNAFIAGTFKSTYPDPKIHFGTNSQQNTGEYDIIVAALGYGVSIKDEEFDKYFSVFPNPAHAEFNLSASGITTGKFNCKIYDVTGKLLTESNTDFKQNNVLQFSVPSGYKGLLMLMLTSQTGQIYTRSVICN